MNEHASHLRSLLATRAVMCPGAYNALVARAVAQAGFEACYISGGATANSAGYPDIGLITLTEMSRTIREIAQASRLPIIADADTGYGEVESVMRTTVEYERAGAAGLHIEDQVFPKRCGHLEGKELIAREEMVEKVRAACAARLSNDFLVIARTDARSIPGRGGGMNEAVARGCAYREAGADMIFPEGLESADEFALYAKECPGLLLANMTEFGKTPPIPFARFEEMGYRLVIYPLSMQRVAMGHITRALEALRREGSAESLLPEMQTRKELYDLLEYDPAREWRFPKD